MGEYLVVKKASNLVPLFFQPYMRVCETGRTARLGKNSHISDCACHILILWILKKILKKMVNASRLPQIDSVREISMLESASIASRAATSGSVQTGHQLQKMSQGSQPVQQERLLKALQVYSYASRVKAAATRTIRIYMSFIFNPLISYKGLCGAAFDRYLSRRVSEFPEQIPSIVLPRPSVS